MDVYFKTHTHIHQSAFECGIWAIIDCSYSISATQRIRADVRHTAKNPCTVKTEKPWHSCLLYGIWTASHIWLTFSVTRSAQRTSLTSAFLLSHLLLGVSGDACILSGSFSAPLISPAVSADVPSSACGVQVLHLLKWLMTTLLYRHCLNCVIRADVMKLLMFMNLPLGFISQHTVCYFAFIQKCEKGQQI